MKNSIIFHDSSNQVYGLFLIKLGCLFFLTTWFFIACLSNFFDLMHVFFNLGDWQFRSNNYLALEKVLQIYHSPKWFLNILFSLDTLVQAISSLLFAISFIVLLRFKKITPIINVAFGVSMALWATFIIMEEIFIAYSYESTHIRLFGLELCILLFIYVLPHHESVNLQ